MTTLNAKLDALALLEAAATPGPWQTDGDRTILDKPAQHRGDVVPATVLARTLTHRAIVDARLIAALRNIAPELLAVVRAADAWRDKPYATNADPEWLAVCIALDNLEAKL